MRDRDGRALVEKARTQVVHTSTGTHDLLGKVGVVEQVMEQNCWVRFGAVAVCLNPKQLRTTDLPVTAEENRSVLGSYYSGSH